MRRNYAPRNARRQARGKTPRPDGPVQNHIAHNHIFFRNILRPVRRENNNTPAGKPLAHIIIGFTFKGKADPMGQKSAKALACRTIKFNLNSIIRQSRQPVFSATRLESMVPTVRLILRIFDSNFTGVLLFNGLHGFGQSMYYPGPSQGRGPGCCV